MTASRPIEPLMDQEMWREFAELFARQWEQAVRAAEGAPDEASSRSAA
jgi:hypothetical protein